MNPLVLAFAFTAGLGSVALIFYARKYFSRDAQLLRRLKGYPRPALADVGEGERIAVRGRAKAESATLKAPLTGRPCLGWRVVVQQYRSLAPHSPKTLLDITQSVDFDVTVGAEAVAVHVSCVELLLTEHKVFSPQEREEAMPRLRAFLREHGSPELQATTTHSLIFREGAIESDAFVLVGGVARWDSSSSPDLCDRLRLAAPTDSEILITNEPDIVDRR